MSLREEQFSRHGYHVSSNSKCLLSLNRFGSALGATMVLNYVVGHSKTLSEVLEVASSDSALNSHLLHI